MSVKDKLIKGVPELIADVELFTSEEGGRAEAALHGWACQISISQERPLQQSWGAWPLLNQTVLQPGDHKRLGFVFSNPDAIDIIRSAQSFFLWEARFIGQGIVVED